MDEGLGTNDPYNNMNSAEQEMTPDFLKKKNSSAEGALSKFEQAASLVGAVAGGGAGAAAGGAKAGSAAAGSAASGSAAAGEAGAASAKAGGAKKSGESGFYKGAKEANDSAEKAEGRENNLYKGRGSDSQDTEDEPGLRIPRGLKMASPILIIVLGLFGIIALIIGLPIAMIGAIDYNLQKALGFTETVGILEKQAEHVTAELAASGEFPANYAKDLALNGVDVGQVTANGDFIKTNTYIANIEEKNDLVAAASGFSYSSDEEGELALLYNGDVIKAGDFVAAVESDPKLYAAFSAASNIKAKYYYGDDVNKTFKEMGISRGNFNNWELTGDYKTDEASFLEIMDNMLDTESNLAVGGRHKDEDPKPIFDSLIHAIANLIMPNAASYNTDGTGEGTFHRDVTGSSANKSASEIVGDATGNTKEYITGWHPADEDEETTGSNGLKSWVRRLLPDYSDDAKERAAELLNTAVSSGEPYLAASSFMAIEEPIQRARIDGDGPVNQLMNILSKQNTVEYQNAETGEMESKTGSIMDTTNFQAAVGESKYSAEEAVNFARDRVLQITGLANKDIINTTIVSTNGKKNATSVVRNGKKDADGMDEVAKAEQSVDLALVKKNSEVFQSVIGGNRLLEGGSFLSNTINMRNIGAMPSDEAAIAKYDKVVEETLARKAEAERASLSPFDISSPNTFFGSIVHNIATAVLRNPGGSAMAAMGTASSVASNAIAGLVGNVTAEGTEQKFTTMSGQNCETAGTVSVECDLYGTSHNTSSTEYMERTLEDWLGSEVVGESLEENGDIKEGSEAAKFVLLGMDRYTSVGVKSADVCEKFKDLNPSIFNKFLNIFKDVVGIYNTCDEADEEDPGIATGAIYTFGEMGMEGLDEFSGYMLYNQVRSLLTEEKSAVAKVEEEYYAKHPKDDSTAGKIARISGMTKAEAEIALAYSDYLNVIANYDASNRYLFGAVDLKIEQPILEAHSNKLSSELLAWHMKEIEYRALRNRQEVVS